MIPVRARKVLSDLLTRWGRTLIALFGLSFGLFGAGAVLVALLILSDDLNANFRRTNPPNLTMDTSLLTDPALARLKATPGVTGLERRGVITGRIEIGRERWMGVVLYVIDDFRSLKVARFYRESGAWPPPEGSILLERDSRFFIGRRPPGPMGLRLADGRIVHPPLAGLAFDPGQAPSRMEQVVTGYVSRATLLSWGVTPTTTRLVATVDGADAKSRPAGAFDFVFPDKAGDRAAEAKVRAAARALKAQVVSEGARPLRLNLQPRLQHPHQFQLNATLALLGAVAAICLALAVMLTVNLVDSIMAGEQRAIGVMKALGARSGQIARDYLIGMGVLGLVSGLIAMPGALWLGRIIAKGIAAFLNFEILTQATPLALGGAVMALAVATPLLVAALRVRATVARPVREALARPSTARPSRLAEALGALATPLPMAPRMAIRDLTRNPRRAILTGLALAFGLVFFLTALNLRAALNGTVEEVRQSKPVDLAVSFRTRQPAAEMRAWITQFPNVGEAEFWSSADAVLEDADGVTTSDTPVTAVPDRSTMIRPAMIAGRWLDPKNPEGVVATQKLMADEPMLRLGGRYRLVSGERARPVHIVGVVKEFGGGAVYAAPSVVDALTGADGQSNLMLVRLKRGGYGPAAKLGRQIETSVNQSDWRIGSIVTSGLLEVVVKAHIAIIADLLLGVAAVMLAVGALGLASSIGVSVVERYREIGVLKAVGARSRAIAALFAFEAVFIAVIGWLAALAAAPWVSRALSDAFGTLIVQYPFAYRSDPWAPALALGVAVLIALLAAAAPIRAALKAIPLKTLRTA